MRKPDVDPAALLIAIITVVIAPLTTIGPWDKLNTIVGVVVLIVLWAYTLGGHRRDSLGYFADCTAIGLVMGLIFAISVAWPIQFFWTGIGRTNKRPDFVAAGDSTTTGLVFGLVAAIALTAFLYKRYVLPKKRTAHSTERSVPPLYKKRREPAYNSARVKSGTDSSAVTTGQGVSSRESGAPPRPEPSGNK